MTSLLKFLVLIPIQAFFSFQLEECYFFKVVSTGHNGKLFLLIIFSPNKIINLFKIYKNIIL